MFLRDYPQPKVQITKAARLHVPNHLMVAARTESLQLTATTEKAVVWHPPMAVALTTSCLHAALTSKDATAIIFHTAVALTTPQPQLDTTTKAAAASTPHTAAALTATLPQPALATRDVSATLISSAVALMASPSPKDPTSKAAIAATANSAAVPTIELQQLVLTSRDAPVLLPNSVAAQTEPPKPKETTLKDAMMYQKIYRVRRNAPIIAPLKIIVVLEYCDLSKDRGSCRNYTVWWYFDMEYGGCSRFWYGGCEGNRNRFKTKEECTGVCVEPSGEGKN